MKIRLACPAPAGSHSGNRITALRWARILRSLGHRVRITARDEPCDLLIALHARRSAAAVARFRRAHPDRPVIVALTGTDVYGARRGGRAAERTLGTASRLVALQALAVRELAPALRRKTVVIHQSAEAPRRRLAPRRGVFEVCVLAHLRPVKDPLRAAIAVRRVAAAVRIVHVGRALSPAMARRARREEARNPRYRWLGERPPAEARAILARSRLLILPSRSEGGANVLSEALAAGVPILASRVPGTVGILGRGYPGLFPPGDDRALAGLLERAATDPFFFKRLRDACRERTALISPRRERRAWRDLLAGVFAELPERRARFSARSRAVPRRPRPVGSAPAARRRARSVRAARTSRRRSGGSPSSSASRSRRSCTAPTGSGR